MARTTQMTRRPAPKGRAPIARRNQAPRRIARRTRAAARAVADKSQKLMTPAAGASVIAGTALGGAIGARIAASGKLTPNQTAAVMVGSGAGATYIGYRYDMPIVFGGGIGVATAGVNLAVSHQASKAILAQEAAKARPRNARPMVLEDDMDEDDVLDEIDPILD